MLVNVGTKVAGFDAIVVGTVFDKVEGDGFTVISPKYLNKRH